MYVHVLHILCMCMCVHIYVCVHIYTHIHIRMYIYTYIYIYICSHVCIYIYRERERERYVYHNLSIYLSIYLSVCLSIYPRPCGAAPSPSWTRAARRSCGVASRTAPSAWGSYFCISVLLRMLKFLRLFFLFFFFNSQTFTSFKCSSRPWEDCPERLALTADCSAVASCDVIYM